MTTTGIDFAPSGALASEAELDALDDYCKAWRIAEKAEELSILYPNDSNLREIARDASYASLQWLQPLRSLLLCSTIMAISDSHKRYLPALPV